ncbi:NADase-type glycan-binding domain-containing protein [Marmoricola sp. RAF53]|uniref:NADase-type glycan-binding domain-containing protein n=1 Tax=Marmoricola sp. RAF53 TaxID=3233059 RepID=UPI003F973DBE
MSGPESPENPPPELPEEYLAAYNEAYRRALEAEDVVHADPATGRHRTPAHAASAEVPVADEVAEEFAAEPVRADDPGRPGWLVPALLAALALLLVLGAYGIGKLVGDDEPNPPGPSASPTAQRSTQRSTEKSPTSTGGAWDGKVGRVDATGAAASCTARPGVDSAGKPVRYRAANTLDGDPSTAWRCDGDAVGEKLRFALPDDVEVAEVGLVPGYAKTDPASGTDRYAENNRITQVRWTFGDGSVVEQTLDPDPKKRSVQTLRVPATATHEVTLEILAVAPGPRNTTAISEVRFGAAER